MFGYQHNANGIEILRAIGFCLADLSAAIKHVEFANIGGFLD